MLTVGAFAKQHGLRRNTVNTAILRGDIKAERVPGGHGHYGFTYDLDPESAAEYAAWRKAGGKHKTGRKPGGGKPKPPSASVNGMVIPAAKVNAWRKRLAERWFAVLDAVEALASDLAHADFTATDAAGNLFGEIMSCPLHPGASKRFLVDEVGCEYCDRAARMRHRAHGRRTARVKNLLTRAPVRATP